jgi:hypothetical protein
MLTTVLGGVSRAVVRDIYWRHAVVSTNPTPAGRDTLDPFHVFGGVKHLRKKPMHAFTDDCFLRIVAASKGGFLEYTVSVPEEVSIRYR